MSDKKLTVRMGEAGIEIGTLFFERKQGREASVFRYAQNWISNPNAFPLCPSMPLVHTPYSRNQTRELIYPFPGPIADACPDSWGREIARLDHSKETGAITSIDYLTGIEDHVRIGALRFVDDNGKYLILSDHERKFKSTISIDLKDLALSARAVEERTATTKDIRRLRSIGSALGGARPKASVTDDQGGMHIAKFSVKGESLATEKMEVATHWLARAVGIQSCDAQVVTNRDFDPVALIKRFDRNSDGTRIPYITAKTMLDVESAVGSTYTEIAYAIRAHGDGSTGQLRELFRRVSFNVLVSNVDDHLMNHGFLHIKGGKWYLAPMFDVNPAPERANTLKTAISEISGNEASIEALLDVATEFDLSRDQGAAIVGQMATVIFHNWKDFARRAEMSAGEIRAYTDAFEHQQSKFAIGLSTTKITMQSHDGNRDDQDVEFK
jgi:serine/threonine-protein kinase HipA